MVGSLFFFHGVFRSGFLWYLSLSQFFIFSEFISFPDYLHLSYFLFSFPLFLFFNFSNFPFLCLLFFIILCFNFLSYFKNIIIFQKYTNILYEIHAHCFWNMWIVFWNMNKLFSNRLRYCSTLAAKCSHCPKENFM